MTTINPLLQLVYNTLVAKRQNATSRTAQCAFYNRALEAYGDFFRKSHYDATIRIPQYLALCASGEPYEVKEYQAGDVNVECPALEDKQVLTLLSGEFPCDSEGVCLEDEMTVMLERGARERIAIAKDEWDTFIKDNPDVSVNEKITQLLNAYYVCVGEVYLDYNFAKYDKWLGSDYIVRYQYAVMKWLSTF